MKKLIGSLLSEFKPSTDIKKLDEEDEH